MDLASDHQSITWYRDSISLRCVIAQQHDLLSEINPGDIFDNAGDIREKHVATELPAIASRTTPQWVQEFLERRADALFDCSSLTHNLGNNSNFDIDREIL